MEGEEQPRKKANVGSASAQPTLFGYFSHQCKCPNDAILESNRPSKSAIAKDSNRLVDICDDAAQSSVVVKEGSPRSGSVEETVSLTTDR